MHELRLISQTFSVILAATQFVTACSPLDGSNLESHGDLSGIVKSEGNDPDKSAGKKPIVLVE